MINGRALVHDWSVGQLSGQRAGWLWSGGCHGDSGSTHALITHQIVLLDN